MSMPLESHHSQFSTPSTSPTATEHDITSPHTRSTEGTYGLEYQNLPHSLVQWTEPPEHGVDWQSSVPGSGPSGPPPFLSTSHPVSPTRTTHSGFDNNYQKCGPELLTWQNNQTASLWPQEVTGFQAQPANLTSLYRYHSNQLIAANRLDPIISRNYDSSGFSDQEIKKPRTVSKMETLRKRRNNASSESGAEQRQSKSRMTGSGSRKGAGTPRIDTQATTNTNKDMSSKSGRKSIAATMGPGGMLSPTSPVISSTSDTQDTEQSPHDVTAHSDEEGSPLETEEDPAVDHNTARLKHNKVERKYRNRLNNHFEQLLGVLPPSSAGTDRASASNTLTAASRLSINTAIHGVVDGGLKESSSLKRKDRESQRKVSKSEVLDRARMYIQSLEIEHQRLVAERKELLQRWDGYGRSN